MTSTAQAQSQRRPNMKKNIRDGYELPKVKMGAGIGRDTIRRVGKIFN